MPTTLLLLALRASAQQNPDPIADAGEPAAAPSTSVLEYRRAPAERPVYRQPLVGGQRGILAADEPFAVLAHVDGPACAAGWARLQGDGFVCLDGTEVTSEPPVQLPRLIPFDPPMPSEFQSYVATGTWDRTPAADAEAFLPDIYGKPWRRGGRAWRAHMWSSLASYEQGDPPSGVLGPPISRHRFHFEGAVETPRGEVLVAEDGRVAPVDDVFMYPVDRLSGFDLENSPLPEGMMAAFAIDYDLAAVHRAPSENAEIAKRLDYHSMLQVRAIPADPAGHWYELPDALGPGVPGYVEDLRGIRHPTKAAIPTGIGADDLWIDVDLAQQVLTAYRGETPIRVTLVASGDIGWATPRGVYRISEKAEVGDMQSKANADEPYYVEDVPWVMHFRPRYALHGVYWHWGFGHRSSHGCVNLAPHDAAWVFSHTGPTLPPGWKEVYESPEDPGTVVRVRNGTDGHDVLDFRKTLH